LSNRKNLFIVPDTTTVIIPTFPNRRIEAQKGAFSFTRDSNIQAYSGGQFTVEVLSNDDNKKKILIDLEKLGYNEDSIFPNLNPE
jgi:ArsR family metal-binding transcriptional regulator